MSKMPATKKPHEVPRDAVEESSAQEEAVNSDARNASRGSGRVIRPSTAEIRYEAMRISDAGSLTDFEQGILTALQWMLGERKTLRRSDK